MRCARRPRNGSVMPGLESVPTATNGLNAICIIMWLRITWTWHSCGGAQCPGAQCGRARHRIAWIMFGGGGGGGHMMYHGTLNRPVWSSSFPHGQFGASFSQIRSRPFIPGFQLTFSSCSATSIFRRTVASASQPSREDCMAIGCVSLEKVAIPELGVAPLVDPDTDLEDELPTPEDSMLLSYSSPVFRGFIPRLRISPIWSWRRHCSACLFCLSW